MKKQSFLLPDCKFNSFLPINISSNLLHNLFFSSLLILYAESFLSLWKWKFILVPTLKCTEIPAHLAVSCLLVRSLAVNCQILTDVFLKFVMK